MPGILYIVATPIGNLEDITLRALRILKEVDAVVSEDTRHTRALLSHFNIHKRLVSYFEYSKKEQEEGILRLLESGQNLALVTDAGTPTLSDPGARLVYRAHQRGIRTIPLPGPSAILTALSVSGLPTSPFHFWGFLSPKASRRKRIYETILSSQGSHCFFESPHRLKERLDEWLDYFGDHYVCVGKEMTKKFETFWVGQLKGIIGEIGESGIRGEYTIILSKELLVR